MPRFTRRARVASTALCLCASAALLTGCGDKAKTSSTASSTTQQPTSQPSTPSTTVSGSATASGTAGAPGAPGTVPVYWLGDTKRSTFLYREFVKAKGSGDPVEVALTAMMSGRPVDPDYRSMWQSPTRLTVRSTDEGITVDVSSDAFGGNSLGRRQAERSIQQLVWTATAAAHSNVPVTVLVDGKKEYRAWDTVTLGAPIKRVPTARAPIWIDSPTQGSTVKPGAVPIKGSGNVFEGNVVIEITDAAGKKVATTLGEAAMGTYQPFTTKANLKKPGRYTLTAYSPDESDGEAGEGPKMFPVTTTFTVK